MAEFSLVKKQELFAYLRGHPDKCFRVNDRQIIYYDQKYDLKKPFIFVGIPDPDDLYSGATLAGKGDGIVIRTERK